jgi:hypothetical protein
MQNAALPTPKQLVTHQKLSPPDNTTTQQHCNSTATALQQAQRALNLT